MNHDFSSIDAASIPSELTGPLPRRLRLSKNGIWMATAAAVMLALTAALALWFALDGVQQTRQRTALRQNGREAAGEITRVWSAGRSLKTKVAYSFVVNGVPFAGEARVPNQLVPSLYASNAIPIQYLPENPAINHPTAWEWTMDWDSFFGPAVGMALTLFLFTILRSERRLVAGGSPAAGTITRCTPGRKGGFSVSFEFRAQDGDMTKGTGWSQSRQEVGERVCVLYLPQNPRRNLSYPSLNYRVAQ